MLFRDLSTPAQIVYHVTRRIKNHKTDSFFHSIETLIKATGKSECTVRRGLNDLVKAGILSRTERIGHTALYKFISIAPLYPHQSDTLPLSNRYPSPINLIQGGPQSDTHNNSPLTDRPLTTTWLDDQLCDKLISSYGEQAVNDRVVVIASLNGKIKNKAGLLVDSLKRGYMPASKELREKEEKARHEELIQARIETERLEREKMIQEYDNSQATVDLVAMLEQSFKEKANNDQQN
jgi:hypothetical protein